MARIHLPHSYHYEDVNNIIKLISDYYSVPITNIDTNSGFDDQRTFSEHVGPLEEFSEHYLGYDPTFVDNRNYSFEDANGRVLGYIYIFP